MRLATKAIADLPRTSAPIAKSQSQVILGYDTRFLGREFSLAAAEVFAANGLNPLLCDRDTPTPVIAHTIRARKALGGINMTASHNPAEYQGLKFSTSNGAPATPEVTKQIEANVAETAGAELVFQSRGRSAPSNAKPSIRSRTISNKSASSSISPPSARPS